jgi:hypothetical protein
MKNFIQLALASLLLPMWAGAQPSASTDGVWKGALTEPSGMVVNIVLTFKGSAGIFVIEPNRGARMSNPCVGRELPAAINDLNEDSMRVTVQGNLVSRGCFTQVMSLSMSLTEGTAVGQTGDGRPVSLKRER